MSRRARPVLFASYGGEGGHDFWIHLRCLIWITIAAPCSGIFVPRFARVFASVAKNVSPPVAGGGRDVLHVLAHFSWSRLFVRRTVTRIKPFSVTTTRFSALQRYIITIIVINPRGICRATFGCIRAPSRRSFFVLGCCKRGKLLASHNSAVYCYYITFARV